MLAGKKVGPPLRMSLVLPNGRPKGLQVAEEGHEPSVSLFLYHRGGKTLVVVEEGTWPGKEHESGTHRFNPAWLA